MNFILEFLFPKRCVGCRQFGIYLCDSCIQSLKQADLVCPRCERPAIGGQTHPVCKRRYGLDGLWSLGVYKDPLREAIKQLKYRWVRQVAESLVDITLEYWVRYQPFLLDIIKKDQGRGWLIVPVPLHWRRENERGFNQSALLGKLLSQKLGLEYSEPLKRIKYTKPQVNLKSWQRRQNIKNAFLLDSRFLIHDVSILLIDDVWTTGSTLRECCYVLKKNGSKKVWALTLAR